MSIHQSSVSLNRKASVFQAEIITVPQSVVVTLLKQDKPYKTRNNSIEFSIGNCCYSKHVIQKVIQVRSAKKY
uniref:Uncharacterized protein n=1 Tax=Lepeophtheirus salmonis TaxID=72036 RepID=A0A0K2VCX8_LEPSM